MTSYDTALSSLEWDATNARYYLGRLSRNAHTYTDAMAFGTYSVETLAESELRSLANSLDGVRDDIRAALAKVEALRGEREAA